MAYTNAVFYMDLVSGSDAARTTFAPTAYANNGAGLVRVTKTAHGLVTGAIIDITGTTSAVYDGAWKITRIDADNFDLDTSTFTSNPAAKGTVAPRGGMSWTDAWLTPTSGATAARVAAGDEIRIAKTNDPVSIGNATWTSRSTTVTLATAQTATIDNCETAWTAVNSGSVSRTTGGNKEGTYRMDITTSSSTTTNTRYAYRTLPATLDLSAYQQITFWVQLGTTTTTDDRWVINLCSDTLGVTVVDSFLLTRIGVATQWVPVTLTKSGGGNLGNSIASIAVYTGTVSPGNSQTIRLDNISASKTNTLNLNSLIGQSSNGYSLTLPWNTIQSIDGTTVKIDRLTSSAIADSLGYYTEGTSPNTVATYSLNPYTYTAITSSSSTNIYTLNTTGTATAFVKWLGGWNTSNTTQDGITWLDNRYSNGGILFGNGSARNYNSFLRIGFSRVLVFFNCTSTTNAGDIEVMGSGTSEFTQQGLITNSATGYLVNSGNNFRNFSGPNIQNVIAYNNGDSATFGTSTSVFTYVNNVLSANNTGRGFSINGNSIVENITVRYCTDTGSGVFLFNTVNLLTPHKNITVTNNTGYGINVSSSSFARINNLTTASNSLSAIRCAGGILYLNNSNMTDSTLITQTANNNGGIFITNLNGSATDSRISFEYGNTLSQTSVRKSASGIAWQTNVTNTKVTSVAPLRLPVAKIACTGNKLVTVKAWVKLSHATDIGAKLVIRGGQLPGITADVTATKAADTNWEELTITFTPTIAGVAEIELWSYWLANLADESTYIDDMTITEAA